MRKNRFLLICIMAVMLVFTLTCSAAAEKQLMILSRKPVVMIQPKNTTVCAGDPISFSIGVAGKDLQFRWSYEIGGETYLLFDGAYNRPDVTLAAAANPDIHNGMKVSCYIWNDYGDTFTETAVVTVSPRSFEDVRENDWYYADVMRAVENGLISGVSATEFKPQDNITIAAVIKLSACLHQLRSQGTVTLTPGETTWYDPYVEYAKEHGVIQGDEWLGFYNKEATRLEFVRILYPALPAYSYTDPNYIEADAIPDLPSDANWAGPVYVFYRAGILTGSDTFGSFRPGAMISRGEVAAILTRMVDASTRRLLSLPIPDLGEMAGPMCWTAVENRFVFITEQNGKPAVVHGLFDSETQIGHIRRATRQGDLLTLELYYPAYTLGLGEDAEVIEERYESLKIDLSGLDVDGRVKISVSGGEYNEYYPAGPTFEDGYRNTHES